MQLYSGSVIRTRVLNLIIISRGQILPLMENFNLYLYVFNYYEIIRWKYPAVGFNLEPYPYVSRPLLTDIHNLSKIKH